MDLKSKYGIFQKISFDKLYVRFLGLEPREQTIVLVFAGLLVLSIVVAPIALALTELSRVKESMIKASQSLVQIDQKIGDLKGVQSELEAFESLYRHGASRSISTSIEALASEAGISGSIDAIKERPSRGGSDVLEEVGVDVRLSKVSLEGLVNFLHGIESNEGAHLRIKSMQIKPRFKTRSQLDANLEVVSYELRKGES